MMQSRSSPTSGLERQAFYNRLALDNLAPLWEVLSDLVTTEPCPAGITAHWRFSEIRPKLMEAGTLITAQEAERRVLILENPAWPGQSRITATLYAGLQLLLPGEVAPAHRHTQSALRFVIEGEGAFTALDGERAYMSRYDLVLTPNWVWHDHGNETDQPIIWLDGLDIPLIRALATSFAEHRPDRGPCPPSRPAGDANHRWGRNLRPARGAACGQTNPLFRYPYAEWRATLETLRRGDPPHPHHGYLMEFTNPLDGGPVLQTLSAFVQLVPRDFTTRPMRTTESAVFFVVEGSGRMTVGDNAHEIVEGDIVAVPGWASRHIEAAEDLILFSYSDMAVQLKLGLWREQVE